MVTADMKIIRSLCIVLDFHLMLKKLIEPMFIQVVCKLYLRQPFMLGSGYFAIDGNLPLESILP